MNPTDKWNAEKERIAAGALAGLLVWWLNRGDAGWGITPEVSANITTVVGLVMGYFHSLVSGINELFLAAMNRWKRNIETPEVCTLPHVEPGSTPGSARVIVPQPDAVVELTATSHSDHPAPSSIPQPPANPKGT